jgi:hypothetical protein
LPTLRGLSLANGVIQDGSDAVITPVTTRSFNCRPVRDGLLAQRKSSDGLRRIIEDAPMNEDLARFLMARLDEEAGPALRW